MLDNPVAGPPRAISVSGGGWVRLHVSSASVRAIGQVSSPVLAGPEDARERARPSYLSLIMSRAQRSCLSKINFRGHLVRHFAVTGRFVVAAPLAFAITAPALAHDATSHVARVKPD